VAGAQQSMVNSFDRAELRVLKRIAVVPRIHGARSALNRQRRAGGSVAPTAAIQIDRTRDVGATTIVADAPAGEAETKWTPKNASLPGCRSTGGTCGPAAQAVLAASSNTNLGERQFRSRVNSANRLSINILRPVRYTKTGLDATKDV
jgi:hypothetical protein